MRRRWGIRSVTIRVRRAGSSRSARSNRRTFRPARAKSRAVNKPAAEALTIPIGSPGVTPWFTSLDSCSLTFRKRTTLTGQYSEEIVKPKSIRGGNSSNTNQAISAKGWSRKSSGRRLGSRTLLFVGQALQQCDRSDQAHHDDGIQLY